MLPETRRVNPTTLGQRFLFRGMAVLLVSQDSRLRMKAYLAGILPYKSPDITVEWIINLTILFEVSSLYLGEIMQEKH